MQIYTTKGYSSNGVKVLLYGPTGSRKTLSASTAPRPIVLSSEGGLLSLRKFDIPYIPVNSTADVTQAYNYLTRGQGYSMFDTIYIDSGSDIAEMILAEKRGATKDGRKQYGDMYNEMVDHFKKFRDIVGKNVVITAKVFTDNGVEYPLFPGKSLGPSSPYLFDEVFYASSYRDEQGNVVPYFQTATDQYRFGKDRSGSLDLYEPADFNHIFSKIANS